MNELSSSSGKKTINYSPTTAGSIRDSLSGLKDAIVGLAIDPLFGLQTLENIRGILKPEDNLHHGKDAPTAILIPGFLCNQGVMSKLGEKLSSSMNVIYPDIGIVDYSHLSLSEIATKIAFHIDELERSGKVKQDTGYTIIGHSLGGSLALLVSSKLRARHIVQISTPNEVPPVVRIAGLGYFPAIHDLRKIPEIYAGIQVKSPIARLTSIIPESDKFIGTTVQGSQKIPNHIPIGVRNDIVVPGGHLTPILGNKGVNQVAMDILSSK